MADKNLPKLMDRFAADLTAAFSSAQKVREAGAHNGQIYVNTLLRIAEYLPDKSVATAMRKAIGAQTSTVEILPKANPNVVRHRAPAKPYRRSPQPPAQSLEEVPAQKANSRNTAPVYRNDSGASETPPPPAADESGTPVGETPEGEPVISAPLISEVTLGGAVYPIGEFQAMDPQVIADKGSANELREIASSLKIEPSDLGRKKIAMASKILSVLNDPV